MILKEAAQNLITNSYEERNGNFKEATYGNGHKVSNIYDAMDRVIGKKFGTDLRVKYQYNANNNLALKEDLVNKKNYRYNYDLADRLSAVKEMDSATSKIINETRYNYDLNNNVSEVNENINNYNYNIAYGYNKDNKPTSITHKRGTLGQQLTSIYNISYGYDILGRLENKKIAIGTTNFQTNYKYYEGKEANSTTNLIKTIENGGKAISYEYDSKGNISKILEGDKVIQQYYYNEVNELIREDNKALEKTIAYSYDFGGNILNKKIYSIKTGEITESDIPEETINYTYEDTVWKDKLTSYNGKPIAYDNIGNPLTYDGYSFTWEGGRQLKGITGNGKTISYKYNDSGIRTEKTVDGVTTTYHLVEDKVTSESNGTDNVYYTYDAAGKLVSMNLNGTEYFYVRNAQNDIIGLVDKAGTQVVSYTYDSWGKLISIDGTLKDTVGVKNPYRYRGYRYDSETQLYYLQSRYYNPTWGRFINADGYLGTPGELLNHNLFAYCANNPVNRDDPKGQFFGELVASVVAAITIPAEIVAVVTVGVIIVATAAIYALVDISIEEYKNKHISVSDTASGNADSKAEVPTVDEGIVYKRTNKKTGENYVGQAQSPERYKARQKEHKRDNPDADFEFEILGRAKPGIDLDILEQKNINELGGLKRKGGELQNRRNQIRKLRWDGLGIK